MNQPEAQSAADEAHGEAALSRRRLRFELIFASIWLATGLFALPAAIFFVGNALLGPYGEGSGLGRFYADFFGDLAEPAGRAWTIALGPLVLVTLIRLVFLGVGRAPAEPAAPHQEPPPPRSAPGRVEPRVSSD